VAGLLLAGACDDSTPATVDGATPLVPGVDAATPDGTAPGLPAGAACSRDDECAGGTCLGAPGSDQAGNPRFTGGYCTHVGCTADSQEGCGPEEWCTTAGYLTFCVEMCSMAQGLTCDREDHVCLGVGETGGCFHQDRVNCDAVTHLGCGEGQVCVQVGFDDPHLGHCEQACELFSGSTSACAPGLACYWIDRYDGALCVEPGTAAAGEACLCDRCCVQGYACVNATPDATSRTCQPYCRVADGCGATGGGDAGASTGADGGTGTAGTCVPISEGAPVGGCVM
jgi:hypothetical protein